MPVNLQPPKAEELLPIAGIKLGIAEANIRKANRKDLLVMTLSDEAQVVAAFTSNQFCAAPVILARDHLTRQASIRALVINTGNANAGTGNEGLSRAKKTCTSLSQLLKCSAEQILPFSTGVIMEPLPIDRIEAGLPQCINNLSENNWAAAAEAIMTTDSCPKASSRKIEIDGAAITITGIAKGSGMIRPNMATMLGFIATDAAIDKLLLQQILDYAVERSFNRITVDGDTSTNDACVLIATGQAKPITNTNSNAFIALRDNITEVARFLAQAIVRDGEGATKFITIQVEQGRAPEECAQVAYAIAHSPLVKTASYASDPNLGRILAAIGYAGITDLNIDAIKLYLNDVLVVENGGRSPRYQEADGQRVMRESEILIRVLLGRGDSQNIVWTCDLSHDYVKINAEYRS